MSVTGPTATGVILQSGAMYVAVTARLPYLRSSETIALAIWIASPLSDTILRLASGHRPGLQTCPTRHYLVTSAEVYVVQRHAAKDLVIPMLVVVDHEPTKLTFQCLMAAGLRSWQSSAAGLTIRWSRLKAESGAKSVGDLLPRAVHC